MTTIRGAGVTNSDSSYPNSEIRTVTNRAQDAPDVGTDAAAHTDFDLLEVVAKVCDERAIRWNEQAAAREGIARERWATRADECEAIARWLRLEASNRRWKEKYGAG